MIHRALFGSVESFFGILLEHYAGARPVWLSPVQVSIVPVADRHMEYANEVAGGLQARGLRVEVDGADDTVGEKIRRTIVDKHPVVLVVGDTDIESDTVGLRIRGEEEERGVSLGEAAERICAFCESPR